MGIYVEKSKNGKVGDVDATYASISSTCPDTCASKRDGSCYAMGGRVALTVRRLDSEGLTPLQAAKREALAIDGSWKGGAVPGRALRLHVSGDAKTRQAVKVLASAAGRWLDRGGANAWTYTHAWKTVPRSAWGRVSVLASVDKPEDVAKARAQGYAPAIVVPEHSPDGKAFTDADGNRWLPCPEQTKGVPCDKCRLCWNADRLASTGSGIAFAAHGVKTESMKRRLTLLA